MMRLSPGVVLAGALFVIVCANAPRASADAWSAAATLEREAIKVHPWDPESFRHPEQYAEDGTKLTGKNKTGKEHANEPPSGPRP
ncbi:MAG TPA: hypothetical protein VEK55_08275 [Xanthobacteraceae bacterium]|nr:hypothetical protein [Xanthobacteraceae bacterium]